MNPNLSLSYTKINNDDGVSYWSYTLSGNEADGTPFSYTSKEMHGYDFIPDEENDYDFAWVTSVAENQKKMFKGRLTGWSARVEDIYALIYGAISTVDNAQPKAVYEQLFFKPLLSEHCWTIYKELCDRYLDINGFELCNWIIQQRYPLLFNFTNDRSNEEGVIQWWKKLYAPKLRLFPITNRELIAFAIYVDERL